MSPQALGLVVQFLVIPAIVLIAAVALYVVVRYRSVIGAFAAAISEGSTTRQLLDTAMSLGLASRQFVRVSTLYQKLNEEHLLSADEVRKWAIFHEHFRTAFHEATDFWRLARQSKRRDLIQRAAKTFDDLIVPLSDFEAQAFKRLASPSAAPPPPPPAPPPPVEEGEHG